jgi:L-ascorbate metabolism protein UlaG (beta-lactamase superfamily)
MEQLGKVDTALLPVGGTYTMNPAEAAEAARRIKPRRCIPYHFGDIVGSTKDAEQFKKLCDCPTDILSPLR